MTTVLKLGGRVATDAVRAALAEVAGDVVVVHGAGPQITAEMERRGIAPIFVRGRRVTTPEVLEVVIESLLEVNAAVCAAVGERAVGLRGDEKIDVTGLANGIRPQMDVTMVITRADGTKKEVPVLLRIDTPIEVDYYLHGGILPFVLRELVSKAA